MFILARDSIYGIAMLSLIALLAAAQNELGDGHPPGAPMTPDMMAILEQMPKKPKPAPLDGDIPYIRCGTCEVAIGHAYSEVQRFMKERTPAAQKKRRFESSANLGGLEENTETLLASMCNYDAEDKQGRWLREFDILKEGSALKLKKMPPGKCRRECRTIEKVCASLLDSLSDSDLGEFLIEQAGEQTSSKEVSQHVCTKMARVCKKGKTPPWPEGVPRKNEQFIALEKKDLEYEENQDFLKKQKGPNGRNMVSINAAEIDDVEGLGSTYVDPRDELKDEL